ncbi:MAG: peptidase E [Armatimonadetes bacterium]|nr:peptidase E [Armatimonadota bacterium]
MSRTIFAIGGGGFDSDQPSRTALDRFFVDLTGKASPKICLIPTATGDSIFRISRFFRAAVAVGAVPSTLELYKVPGPDLAAYLLEHDAIFVSGGNTFNMLALWRAWGLDGVLRQAYEAGIPLGGVSAGANCWFEGCSTDSFFDDLAYMPCLGWLEHNCCPHYDEEALRKPHLAEMIQKGEIGKTLAIDGGVGCLFRDESLVEVVSCSPTGAAFWVEGQNTSTLPARHLI